MKWFKTIMTVLIIVIFIGSLFAIAKQQPQEEVVKEYNGSSIVVANWNLQIFGESKASNDTLMREYAKVLSNSDIAFVQEIRDSSGDSFDELCGLMPDYDCKISSKAGRSNSKEQYGVISKKGIKINEFVDYNPDSLDRWERPPIKVVFGLKDYNLTVYNIHVDPDTVPVELQNMENLMLNESGYVMLLGDLNADCSYYKNNNLIFNYYTWIIPDDADTTVSESDCAYDRIIINQNLLGKYVESGIYTNINKAMSDHYVVWTKLQIE